MFRFFFFFFSSKIVIPGATFLSIRFDPRCRTEKGSDVLQISSSADFDNRKSFSGGDFDEFDLAGDTLYYKFEIADSSDYDGWGYKFTVQGGKIGRFQTGEQSIYGCPSSNCFR